MLGAWRLDDALLISPLDVMGEQAKIAVPCAFPEEYDLDVVVTRYDGIAAFYVGLMTAGRRTLIHLDSHGPCLVALGPVDGKPLEENPTRRIRNVPVLPTDEPVRVRCEVRKSGVRVLANDTVILDWKGDLARLGTDGAWWTEGCAMLAVWETRFHISEFRMIPR